MNRAKVIPQVLRDWEYISNDQGDVSIEYTTTPIKNPTKLVVRIPANDRNCPTTLTINRNRPCYLALNGGKDNQGVTVVTDSRSQAIIYELVERQSIDGIPILADALEEANCWMIWLLRLWIECASSDPPKRTKTKKPDFKLFE